MNRLYDKLKKNIFDTGGDLNQAEGCVFRHLVLDEYQLDEIKERGYTLFDIAEDLNIDFISLKRNKEIEFIHITSLENKNSIEENGLVIRESSHIPDLGSGIYVISEDTSYEEAIANLKDILEETYGRNDTAAVVRGHYSGPYSECVYGDNHHGYIVLKYNVPSCDLEVKEEKVLDIITGW
ncbi:hypothetical protein [Clostridium tertium]|uniref:hypothetical protein n=1 Tax=Clostridium tertium TaxID=1559 RepID=UPI0023B2B304|nr:hypothetical protein [Clostridium tertium]